ncbi:sigma-70 family RNA polymerase sigma factor [Candidatus Poribacteria bacterium]|nr:sigma-70 family RNA polymerase sigma factor [Candidatus Poribacteria bacterium]MYH82319.1 sigma-70 family RNA polymerase sigma factor [Candidatus Poribacteria bacterium]MYK97152.1 sigma-70 family RNA polymerase sigma factor [Candidatus Poribacteria bacterium]
MRECDAALIQRTLDGDEGAFTTLVNKYQKWVHTLVWRKIGDFHTAEELTQDIFLKVYKKLSTLKPLDRFPGWLYVITTRHCITWLRKKQEPTTSLNAMPTTELEALCYAQYEAARGEEASAEHQRELVKRLLQQLPESERTVVTLYYLAEMTSEEVSAFLGVSPNTIRSRLRRARKRLEAQEHLLHDVSGVFQLPPSLTENIINEIARIKPAAPSVGKPWLPWGLSFASTFLVILMIGAGPRALSRFQQPYSLDATSEMTIELVEDPVLLALELKRDLRNQYGITGNVGRGSSTGTKTNVKLLAAAQADTVAQLEAKSEWIPAKGPGGGYVSNLFVTSQKELYAIGGTRLYRLTDDNSTEWMLINAGLPISHKTLIAERNGTLYIATQKHLFVSSDRGATLIPVGPLPGGRAVALLITDPSQVRRPQDAESEMYLVLTKGVFRSTDAGKTWHAFNEGLTAAGIQAAAVIDNALFLGTNPLFLATKQGLYRLNTGVWEKLPIAPSRSIESLAVANNRIYFITRRQDGELSDSLYVSNNFGESWTDITPLQQLPPFAKLAAIGDTLWIIDDGILSSTDAGNTWADLGPHGHGHAFLVNAGTAVALDEETFFIGSPMFTGVVRSDNGGKNWHPFTAGIAATGIQDLAQANNVLYAATSKGIATSTDGGAQWAYIQPALPFSLTSLTVVGDSLYVRENKGNSTHDLFHLQPHTDTLHPVEGMPVYVAANPDTPDPALERVPNTVTTPPVKIQEGKIRRAGEFAISGDTFYIEYERKLYRWTRGEHKWYDTGIQDAPAFGNNYFNGLQFAVSGKVIYLGKSDGSLFQSLDGGDTWRDITATFPFPLDKSKLPLVEMSELQEMMRKLPHFKDIVYVGNTVYIITNDGGAMSNDGENWHPLTNEKSVPITVSELAVKGTTLYGASETGAYRLNNETNTWIQIAPEVPGGVTSLVVADDGLYVGTNYRGVLRLPLHGLQ